MPQITPHPLVLAQAHALEIEVVLQHLQTQIEGLSAAAAAERLDQVGPNQLPAPPGDGLLKRFFKHFNDVLIYILIAAGVITAFLGHWIDSSVIFGVVVINAIIGFLQEGKAERALEGIRNLLSPQADARRDGQWINLPAATLVPGDLVRLRSGDRVPADLRLIEAVNLRIEESALTGESVPTEKTTAAVLAQAGVGDRHSMAYSGTLVAAGRGLGVVTGTGIHTELGRINQMVAQIETLATPLTRQMAGFSKVLSIIILAMAVGMFLIGWQLHGFQLGILFMAAIGFAVAAIPEGLPAILTIILAIGVQRMARRNAITRKLTAVETLGSVTVICSDKTGTLTKNEMTARHLITRAGSCHVEGLGYAPSGHILDQGQPVVLAERPDLQALIETLAVCNDAEIMEEQGHWRVVGEPTEGALRTLGQKAGFDRSGYQRLDLMPFESENKFMATLEHTPSGLTWLLVKGAPDRLLDRCQWQRSATGDLEPLDRGFWEQHIDVLSAQGLRVLAAASCAANPTQTTLTPNDLNPDLSFLGLVGIIDPPRPEAISAIRACRQAGIQVKMITGDHAGTASAIGREMGLTDTEAAVTGEQLEAASDQQLQQIVKQHAVFARTSPEHKLRLVQALQANHEVVAMTGDGVNDAPALKRADVGVAMGIKGTEATKEAAEIVLADDNFASIERAVEEGRTIYDNLQKALLFILPTNGAQGFVVLAAVVFGLTLPLLPVQILWVNMVTAVTLALSLAFEPSEPGLMQRPPRKSGTPILSGYFLWRITFVSLLIGSATLGVFLYEQQQGLPLPLAHTLAVNTLVITQAFYLFNSRFLQESSLRAGTGFTNPVVWLTVAVLAVLQLIFVYTPFMHTAFHSAPLEARHWIVPLATGLAVFLAIEAEKALLGRKRSTATGLTAEQLQSKNGMTY